jgi:hypothetical protein
MVAALRPLAGLDRWPGPQASGASRPIPHGPFVAVRRAEEELVGGVHFLVSRAPGGATIHAGGSGPPVWTISHGTIIGMAVGAPAKMVRIFLPQLAHRPPLARPV